MVRLSVEPLAPELELRKLQSSDKPLSADLKYIYIYLTLEIQAFFLYSYSQLNQSIMYNSKVRHDLLNLCCINTNCGINIPLTCSKMGVVKGFVCVLELLLLETLVYLDFLIKF